MLQIDLQQTYRHGVRRLEIPANASHPGTTCLTTSTSTGRSHRTA